MSRFAATATALLALVMVSFAIAQPSSKEILITLPDGSQAPFTIEEVSRGGRSLLQVYYASDGNYVSTGFVQANVGGASNRVPIDQIARAELVEPGTETVWRFTLNDGRVLDGAIEDNDAYLRLEGKNQFGAEERLSSYPLNPNSQPFIAVNFDPDGEPAAGGGSSAGPTARPDNDTVNLRNGDVLSGEILTDEFIVEASYGTLSFTKDQVQSIAIEDSGERTDQVVLDVGDQVSGVLQNESIEITLTSGATVTLEKGNIGSIKFATGD